ncbi:MAG: hypothetical protein V4858_04305 [Pseudomonadota bacterium]
MRDRFKQVLLNPTWEQIVERDPLVAYSHYLSGRVHVLLAIADEVVENLDEGFSVECINGGRLARAESLMWLWILGAYEVVRTMCQSKTCFSQQTLDELQRLKKALSIVRMPAAKMEKPGIKRSVTSDRSPSGWNVARRDLLVNDPESTDVFARELLGEFDRVFSSIKASDILGRHEDAYPSEG